MIQLSNIYRSALLFAVLVGAFSARAAGLPDTGISTCYNDTVADGVAASNAASIARDAGTHPRQDCRYGRDPATTAGATKTGAGAKGLDYTKIANDGTSLAAGAALGAAATDWACTQDNITGLMWEVKASSGLRNSANTYTWYDSNATTNGGVAGTANGGVCVGGSGCDTEKFVTDVNALAGANRLCGATDWRLPTERELMTLSLLDGTSPSIDTTYFPNTVASLYWSAPSFASTPTFARIVDFSDGKSVASAKTNSSYVRLVRGTPF